MKLTQPGTLRPTSSSHDTTHHPVAPRQAASQAAPIAPRQASSQAAPIAPRRRGPLRWLALLGIVCFTVACGKATTPDPQIRYLPSPGSVRVDPQADESVDGLYKTLTKAVASAGNRWVQLVAGTYAESITVAAGQETTILGNPKAPATLKHTDDAPLITVEKGATLRLQNITLSGGARGIVLKEGANLLLERVTFESNLGQAIFAEKAALTLRQVTIKDLRRPSDAQFKEFGSAQGIQMKGGKLLLLDSLLENTGDRALGVSDDAQVLIVNSRFRSLKEPKNTRSALGIMGGTTLMESSQIEGWKEGVFVQNASVTITRSTIAGTTGNAILVTEGSLDLTKSEIKAPGKSGASLLKADVLLQDNDILEAGEYGIFLSNPPATGRNIVVNNRIKNAKAAGIQFLNAPAWAANNTVEGTKKGTSQDDGHGIAALDTDGLQLHNNISRNNIAAGAFLLRSSGHISGNNFAANPEGGLLLLNANVRSLIEKNIVSKNHIAGIFLLTSKADLRQNKISETVYVDAEKSGSGIVLFGASEATIEGDTSEKNAQHGLLIAQNSKGTARNSTFSGNKNYGAFVDCANSTLTQSDNTYKDNNTGEYNTCP